jgi:hypothetical protein
MIFSEALAENTNNYPMHRREWEYGQYILWGRTEDGMLPVMIDKNETVTLVHGVQSAEEYLSKGDKLAKDWQIHREHVYPEICFGQALIMLENDFVMSRKGWNGKNMWIALQRPDKHSKMTLPYIYMYTACGNKVPWLASQTDLLAKDWTLVCNTGED